MCLSLVNRPTVDRVEVDGLPLCSEQKMVGGHKARLGKLPLVWEKEGKDLYGVARFGPIRQRRSHRSRYPPLPRRNRQSPWVLIGQSRDQAMKSRQTQMPVCLIQRKSLLFSW
jgi:hypothetical protein